MDLFNHRLGLPSMLNRVEWFVSAPATPRTYSCAATAYRNKSRDNTDIIRIRTRNLEISSAVLWLLCHRNGPAQSQLQMAGSMWRIKELGQCFNGGDETRTRDGVPSVRPFFPLSHSGLCYRYSMPRTVYNEKRG